VVWTRTFGDYYGYYAGGVYDVKSDQSGVYVSGYAEWGTKLFVARLNPQNGATVWQTVEFGGWSWNMNKGLSIALDASSVYVATNSAPDDANSRWFVIRKNKSTGATEAVREEDLTPGYDTVTAVAVVGDYVIAAGNRDRRWYVEKLNKADLTVVASAMGEVGEISSQGIFVEGGSFYLAGSNAVNDATSQLRVEKRSVASLSQQWVSADTQMDTRQGNVHLTMENGDLVVVANENVNAHNFSVGSDARILRLNRVTGQKVSNKLYDGIADTMGLAVDVNGQVYLAGSTTGRVRSAIYKLNDVIAAPNTLGLSITQSVLTQTPRAGEPIQLRIDIDNPSSSSQAAWAFTVKAQVPTAIIGVTWDCVVLLAGTPRGDMARYPTSCRNEQDDPPTAGIRPVVVSGVGNVIQIGHTTNADPLIHPGGKIGIIVNGIVSPSARGSLTSTASIKSYAGWEQNHFFTTNFTSNPTNYQTLADPDLTDNTSSLTITLGSSTALPTPSITLTRAPTRTPTLTSTRAPTPTIPPAVLTECLDPNQILHTVVEGRSQYYCQDRNNNLILYTDGKSEPLNGSQTQVENVRFTRLPTTGSEELVTITFTLRSKTVAPGQSVGKTKDYSLTVRVR
jgi:hypothetical protein